MALYVSDKLRALRIELYQPQAHFRLPFTYQRRLTYPLPPYSTVIGFLANLLGVSSQEDTSFKTLKRSCLAISGHFKSKVTEYTWYRNLHVNKHVERFGSSTSRIVDMTAEHPGGQIPVVIDTLHDFHAIIYLYHPDEGFLSELKEVIEKFDRYREPLHLGRAEDLVVIERLEYVELTWRENLISRYDSFFWVPTGESALRVYRNVYGLRQRITTLYELVNGVRVFNYADVFLADGSFIDVSCYLHEDYPVFLTKPLEAIS